MLGDKEMQHAWMAYADANEIPHDHEDEEVFKYGFDAGRTRSGLEIDMTEYEQMKEQKRKILERQRKPIVEALDALGLALTNYKHQWTDEERRLYDNAIKLLTTTPDPL